MPLAAPARMINQTSGRLSVNSPSACVCEKQNRQSCPATDQHDRRDACESQSVAAFRTCITRKCERATVYWLERSHWWVFDMRAPANGCARLQPGTALHGRVLW